MTPPEPKRRPPLGLPEGSVRALVTLMVVAMVIVQTLRGERMGLLLAETLMVVLAHYFASRRFLKVSPALRRRLERDGTLPDERHPLFLPRHTIRVLVVLAFVGLAAYMVWQDDLWGSPALQTLGIVFAYFLGILVSAVVDWWTRRKPGRKRVRNGWEDAKALAVLLAVGALAAAVVTQQKEVLPDWFRNGTFGLILFYFGSR
ncbi:MAG: hypothetical protein ACYTG6_00655 [Planctomycetota bacterium]